MRVDARLILASALLLTLGLNAQSQFKPEQPVRVRDGGARGEKLVSIFVPPVMNSPFNLVLATEWVRPITGGGTFTLANRRRIERDSKGRIYQERWLLVPKGGKVESQMLSTEVSDPAAAVIYSCQAWEKTCHLQSYTVYPESAYYPGASVSGPLPNGIGFRTHEELGDAQIEGVETKGYRETTTINIGVMGNDRPMVTAREFWYAPKLGLNLKSQLDSPENGTQTFAVNELSLSEPDPGMFMVPEGYTVVDERDPAQRSNSH